MYRQQAERLAHKLIQDHGDICFECYQDGSRTNAWLVNAYDPRSRHTMVFETERQAVTELQGRGAAVR